VPDAELALIVGASGGIGAGIARRLGRDGYHVVLHSRVGSVPGLSEELRAAGIASSEVAVDITEDAQVEGHVYRLPSGRLQAVVTAQAPTRLESSSQPGSRTGIGCCGSI
jgi:3-oxoacyl-[acyl-carrier protein] reductase